MKKMTMTTTPSKGTNGATNSSGFSPKGLVVVPDFTPRTLSFGEVPCYSYSQKLKDELASGRLSKDDALFMYRQVLYIRASETMIIRLRSGELVPHEGYVFAGTTHLSIGLSSMSSALAH